MVTIGDPPVKFESSPQRTAIVNAICRWAKPRREIGRLILFGSRARGEQRVDSDFDLAVEIISEYGHSSSLSIWVCESHNWKNELAPMIPWPIQLEWHDTDGATPMISKGIAAGSYVVFDRQAEAITEII